MTQVGEEYKTNTYFYVPEIGEWYKSFEGYKRQRDEIEEKETNSLGYFRNRSK